VASKSRRGISVQKRPSQCARVYAELRAWYPEECPLPALLGLSPRIADISSRVWELRHKYNVGIINRIQRTDDELRSYYRLARDSAEAASAFGHVAALPPINKPTSLSPDLFSTEKGRD
jgi:hypothetical protein